MLERERMVRANTTGGQCVALHKNELTLRIIAMASGFRTGRSAGPCFFDFSQYLRRSVMEMGGHGPLSRALRAFSPQRSACDLSRLGKVFDKLPTKASSG
jgi:hypothetical protein